MAGRIRSIKPEVLDDDVAAGLSDTAWRLWVSLWVLADDHGDVRASAKYLAASVWQDTGRDAGTPLQELIDKGRVHPYAVQGQRYVRIHAWERHQRVDNRGRPRVPTPEEDDGTWSRALAGDLAESLREPPRTSASLGGSPLRARAPAHDRRETTDPDHRPPTTDPGPAEDPTADVPPSRSSGAVGRSTKGTSLSDDWQPSDAVVAWAAEEGIDALACVEEFRDHWTAIPGARGRKLDWNATFRNRIRTLVEQGRAPRLPDEPPPPPRPANAAKVDAVRSLVAGIGTGGANGTA